MTPNNNPRGSVFLSEAEHREFAAANCSFADWKSGAHAERQRELAAEREAKSAENAALDPYVNGKPPHGSGLTGWKKWRDSQREAVDRLESAEERLRKHIQPTDTLAVMKAGIEKGALKLLASVGIVNPETLATSEAAKESDADALQLEARLAAERGASAEAVEATRIVEGKLTFARKALAALDAREDEFIAPHLRDAVKIAGQQYVKKVAELAPIASRAFAAREMLHQYGDNWGALGRVSLPRPLGFAGEDTALDLRIKPEDERWWKEPRAKLLLDPDANIKINL
jgi:hypothetical protein